jgi:cytochrome P450
MLKTEYLVKTIKGFFGQIEIYLVDKSNYIAVPKGYISISMIREDYQFVKNIQAPKVTYAVWFKHFIFPNPINLFYLRKILRYDHIASYSVICSSSLVRAFFKLNRPIVKLTHVLSVTSYQKIVLQNIKIAPQASVLSMIKGVFKPIGFYEENQKRYPSIFKASAFGNTAYIIHNPKMIRHVLVSKNENYIKGNKYKFISYLLGKGLLTSDGEHWLRNRKIIQSSFNRKSIERAFKIMIDKNVDFLSELKDSMTLDVNDFYGVLTLDILTSSIFSFGSRDKVANLRKQIDHYQRHGRFLLKLPINYPKWVIRGKLKKSIDSIKLTVMTIIKQRQESKDIKGDDLLDLMLSLTYEDNKKHMSSKQIRDEVITLLIAGHETTTLAISWAVYEIARNQDLQNLLREEIYLSLIEHKEINHAMLKELKILDSLIYETLRFYPPAFIFSRQAVEEGTIEGYLVPANVDVAINLFGLHRNPNYWKIPNEFIYDRFYKSSIPTKGNPYLMPFGLGSRSCLGSQFALLEIKVVLINLLTSFYLYPKGSVSINPGFTLTPNKKIKVRLERIVTTNETS